MKRTRSSGRLTPFSIVLIYAVLGILWILFSDRILAWIFTDVELYARAQTVKGWLYVIVTALLLYALIHRSTSSLKHSEAALRQSQESLVREQHLLHTLMSRLPYRIYFKNLEGRYLRVNQAQAEALGLDNPAEAVGKSDFDFFDEEYAEQAQREDQRIVETGTPILEAEKQEVGPDERKRWVAITKGPLFEDDRIVGTFGLFRDITRRKEAEADLQRSMAQLEALRQISLELASEFELDTLLKSIVTHAVELLGSDSGGLFLKTPGKETLTWKVAVGTMEPALGTEMRKGQGLSGTVWAEDRPISVDDYPKWPDRWTKPGEPPFVSITGVPVKWGDEFLGVLDIMSDAPSAFTQEDAHLLSMFATQAASAIHRANLFQAERRQREVAEALEEAVSAVSSTLQLEEVLDRILEQAERVVPADAFNIMLVGDEKPECASIVRWRGYDSEQEDRPVPETSYRIDDLPPLRKMADTGDPVVIGDVDREPDWVTLNRNGVVRSYVAAPIRLGEETIGFLNANGMELYQFDEADADRLQAFAQHAAIAVENARLYRALSRHAEELEARVQRRTQELRKQYAQLEAILQSSTDGIVVTSPEGEFHLANPVARRWLYHSLPEHEAEKLHKAIHSLATEAADHPEQILELENADLQLSAAPIWGAYVEESNVIVVINDVSHLKELERMKSRFVSNVSHELRTPITTIKLYINLLRRGDVERYDEYLDRLQAEAEHQARLVQDILKISTIDADRLFLQRESVDLNELAEFVADSHQPIASQQGVDLSLELDSATPHAHIDRERMAQALSNVVSNAVRYTHGGGRVIVKTGQDEQSDHRRAYVEVEDTGIGIPEEEIEHIFERFYRGQQPQELQISGTGLGLAIAKEIVLLHGGDITVKSEVGEGSTFTIWLPLEKPRDRLQSS